MSELVTLAADFVRLSSEIEAVRRRMLTALTNGAGEAATTTRPIQPAKKAGGSKHPNAIAGERTERKIIELLKESPGLKTSELAKAMNSKTSTTTERLRRMKARNLITPAEGGGWAASAPSA